GQLGLADEAAGLRAQRHRQRDEVGSRQRRPDRARPVDALGGGYRLPAPRDADHAHAQPARRSRDVATDVAEANDAEGGSPQPERIHGRPAPLSLLASEQLDALAHPETPAEGVLGHPRAEDAGGAGQDDARWELRDQKALDAGPHHLDPSERG